jgi:hypothetical protein
MKNIVIITCIGLGAPLLAISQEKTSRFDVNEVYFQPGFYTQHKQCNIRRF